MNETLALVVAGGALIAAGTILLLSRPLTRIVLGSVVLSNGVNLLLLATSGAAGRSPLLYRIEPGEMADPLPQAFVLTAIVISLALTAFLCTMAYRAWQLSGTDDVQDDVEDLRVAQRADYAEERDRLRSEYRAQRARHRTGAEAGEEAGGGLFRNLRRDREQYREARRRARAELRADRVRGAFAEAGSDEDDQWETILGADR
jgi:multicomponent Na+:H+ antiporter subunit C